MFGIMSTIERPETERTFACCGAALPMHAPDCNRGRPENVPKLDTRPGPDLDEDHVDRIMFAVYPNINPSHRAAIRRAIRGILRAARSEGWRAPND